MNFSSRIMRQYSRKILEGSLTVFGLLLFALFIHRQGILLILAISGLLISAITIHLSSRRTSLLRVSGITTFNKLLPLYLLIALILGVGLGILARRAFHLTPFPENLTRIAIIAPLIGITEELIFRGFIQGHIRSAGRIFSILFAASGHTLYKLIVIMSLHDALAFNFQFLVFWTFIVGILLGILREASGSVIPPALGHACFDIILYGGFIMAPTWVWG